MPRPYQVWLRQEAYDYLDSIEMAERQRLLVWIERLGGGSDGRDWQVAVIAAHAVVWWVDSPVREVKVVAIRRADR